MAGKIEVKNGPNRQDAWSSLLVSRSSALVRVMGKQSADETVRK